MSKKASDFLASEDLDAEDAEMAELISKC